MFRVFGTFLERPLRGLFGGLRWPTSQLKMLTVKPHEGAGIKHIQAETLSTPPTTGLRGSISIGVVQTIEIQYPEGMDSEAGKHHKRKVLRKHPETLIVDYKKALGKNRVKTNYVFYTAHPTAWRSALCQTYPNTEERDINDAIQVKVYVEDSHLKGVITVNLYHTGTVLVQGSNTHLNNFQQDFQKLKENLK